MSLSRPVFRSTARLGQHVLAMVMLTAVALVAAPVLAQAPSYPTKPVRARRAVPAGRHHGHPRARGGAEAHRGAGPAVRRRQPPGRRRQHRRRARRQGRAGRLHAADGHRGHARDQSEPLREDAVRPRQGLRAGDPGRRRAERARGQSAGAGEIGGRAHRVREGESRQAQLRVVGQRHVDPPVGRALQGDGRRADDARSLQGQRARADRPRRAARCS